MGVVAETELTHLSGVELAAAVATGQVSASEVVEEHIAVLERTRWTNALAVDRFAEARAEAAQADARVEAGGSLPPLLGVPATIKELIAVEGMPHTGGFPHRRKYREPVDAPVVARLREAGAIVLGLGNTPGPYFWVETNNKLYGRTNNAYDRRRTAGGSSGGDGAIVGSGGAPIALGSDMGGSIRIPAFFNGIFGHLPSRGLVPITGHFPIPTGGIERTLFLGPMTRRAADLMPLLRIISGPDGIDPVIVPMPLGDPDAVSIAGLPVAICTDSSLVPTRPVLRRAVEMAAAALDGAGAAVREVSLRKLRPALAHFGAVAWTELDLADSWNAMMSVPAGSPRRPHPPLMVAAPAAVLRIVDSTPLRLARSRPLRRVVDAAHRAEDALRDMIGDGVLLYPPFPRIAPRHRTTVGQPWLATNTAVFNLFGLPVTQTPLGLGSKGLPLGVQVVADHGNDHVSIAVAGALEAAFGGWVDPREARRSAGR
jgi:fatty acid amide hydrolase 2